MVNVDCAEQVIRTDESLLMIPDHIAEFEEVKITVADNHGYDFIVLDCAYIGFWLMVAAQGVRCPGIGQRFADALSGGREDICLDSAERKLSPGTARLAFAIFRTVK